MEVSLITFSYSVSFQSIIINQQIQLEVANIVKVLVWFSPLSWLRWRLFSKYYSFININGSLQLYKQLTKFTINIIHLFLQCSIRVLSYTANQFSNIVLRGNFINSSICGLILLTVPVNTYILFKDLVFLVKGLLVRGPIS